MAKSCINFLAQIVCWFFSKNDEKKAENLKEFLPKILYILSCSSSLLG